jgi:hypothetical protein
MLSRRFRRYRNCSDKHIKTPEQGWNQSTRRVESNQPPSISSAGSQASRGSDFCTSQIRFLHAALSQQMELRLTELVLLELRLIEL